MARGPRAAFFRRLEDQHDLTVEGAALGKADSGAQQHGGVAVMAAGMHLARRLRGPWLARCFQNGKGVHIRTQAAIERPDVLDLP